MNILLFGGVCHLSISRVFEKKALLIKSQATSKKTTNFTPDREYGWYQQFEKNNKRKKFKQT